MRIFPNLVRFLGCLALIAVLAAAIPPRVGAQTPASSPPPSDPLAVPSGSAEELTALIERLKQQKAPPGDPETTAAFARKTFHTMILAADKLLAAKPTEQQALTAAGAKLTAFVGLKQLGEPGVEQRLGLLPLQVLQAGFPNVARRVQTVLMQIDIATAAKRGKPRDMEHLVDRIEEHVAQPPLQPEDVVLASLAVQALERSKRSEAAAEAGKAFARIFSTSSDPQMINAALFMEGAARRLTSLNRELDLRGTYLDGTKMDWFRYRGKVVLVFFWAGQYEPCKAEIEHVRKVYAAYHDRGFDVLGINCDTERQKAEESIRQQQIPWKNLFETDPKKGGLKNFNAIYYGVMALPTMLLVDQDGRVISIRAHDKELDRKLERLLGPAAPATQEATPAAAAK